jgi:hypothetical protein
MGHLAKLPSLLVDRGMRNKKWGYLYEPTQPSRAGCALQKFDACLTSWSCKKLLREPIEKGCVIERQGAALAVRSAARLPIENPCGRAACVDECFLQVRGLVDSNMG